MFHFGNKDKKPAYGAIFDIGSGTIGIAIAEFDVSKPLPHIVFSQRFQMRNTDVQAKRATVLRRVRETLFSSALVLSQEGLQALQGYKSRAKISMLLVTCSSPWSYNIARTVDYHDNEEFKITESIIDDLVHSAEETIFEDVRNHDKALADKYDVVEQTSVDISVNDYTVSNPIGLKGTSVALSHIVGLMPNEITASVQEIREKLFPSADLRTHTYMLIMYCIIRDIFPRINSLIIIDVTSEAVEFGIVERGLLVENEAFDFGSGTLIRDAMEVTRKTVNEIIGLLSDYGDSKVDFSGLDGIVQKYVDMYAENIVKIMKDRMIPDDIVMTTHRPFEPLFKDILEQAFKKATGKSKRILTIDPKLVDQISSGAQGDVYLALEARFFHKLHGCGEIESN